MEQKYYAMDFAFYSSMGVYNFEDCCEISRAAGYDAMLLSVWDGRNWARAEELASMKSRFGIDPAGVYVVLNLAQGEEDPRNIGILTMLKTMPEGSTVQLAVRTAAPHLRPSDPAGDAPAVAWLRQALAIAAPRHIQILLYHHLSFWIEKFGDALRLCETLGHPQLGVVFCGYHWYALEGTGLAPLIKQALPYLKQVNLSGSRRSPLGFGQVATIEPLDTGEMDNFAVIALLHRLGYAGMLGYLGWDEGGDPYHKLERSLRALKDMRGRAVRHPRWASHIDA
ncbi:MAG: TIM barrel protein [Telluria sp.]